MLEAIRFSNGELRILDQLRLPQESIYVRIRSTDDAHDAIRRMVVRGAPAIAIVGMLGVAIDVKRHAEEVARGFGEMNLAGYAQQQLDHIVTARPTAVNLSNACADMRRLIQTKELTPNLLLDAAVEMLHHDIENNKRLGSNGVAWVEQNISSQKFGVVTICNTGSLATAGYGTALGIIRSLHFSKKLDHAYCLETRPYNQGARLTAYELVHDEIPATLITDSMAAALFRSHPEIRLVVVGADRVAANGDTANKIGTFQLAVIAKHFGVKFVVAAPTASIDYETRSGDDIVIEDRPAQELTDINGTRIAASGIGVWNPAFDVTPYSLIDAIITEKGMWQPKV